jgi:hypothetical protein
MKYATGRDFGGELCRALDVEPGRVSHMKVEVDAGGVAEVEITYFMLEENGEQMVDVMKRYALVPHPDELPYVERPELPRLVQEEVPDV